MPTTINGTPNDDGLTGDEQDNQIEAGDGNDTLAGGVGNDTLNGGLGVDRADYSAASAAVTAELWRALASNDGQGGSDALIGIEHLTGSAFNDLLGGDESDNQINGGDGNDLLFGGSGNDSLSGGAGDDFFEGGAGADHLDGGSGSDTADYSQVLASITANLVAGGDGSPPTVRGDRLTSIENINGTIFNDDFFGNEVANRFYGAAGHDRLFGAGGDDTLLGGEGNDIFKGGTGNDHINGGPGFDRVSYEGVSNAVRVDLSRGGASNDGQGGSDTLTNIEHLMGSGYGDVLVGDALDNWFDGSFGNDTIEGGAGADWLDYTILSTFVIVELWRGLVSRDGYGGQDSVSGIENIRGSYFEDFLVGDEQANIIEGQRGHDSLYGGGGNDTLLGGDGVDFIAPGAGNDSVDGGTWVDTVDYGSATSGVVAELWRNSASNDGQGGSDVLLNIEYLNGGGFNDLLAGNEENNRINGQAGNDSIFGRGGSDTITGGDGDDWIAGGDEHDNLNGGAGIDTADYSAAPRAVTLELWRGTAANDGYGKLDTVTGFENLVGSNFNDYLVGNESANLIRGGEGNDKLVGGGAADTLQGGNGNDLIDGSTGNDLLDGGNGTDTLDYSLATFDVVVELWKNSASYDGRGGVDVVLNFENISGGSRNDFLVGNEGVNQIGGGLGNDTVYAGGGDDLLAGGAGHDRLSGGAGRDAYFFDEALNASTNLDQVIDFVLADDTLLLDHAVFSALAPDALAADQLVVAAGAVAQDANDFILYDSSSGALYYDADGNGAGVAVQFAILPTGLNLTQANFLVS